MRNLPASLQVVRGWRFRLRGFYANLSISDSIERYRNVINNSHSNLDFAKGSGLYVILSDLVIKRQFR